MRTTPFSLSGLLASVRRYALLTRPDPPGVAVRSGPDRLSALLSRHVSLPVALRVTPSGGIEATVPALPDCRVQGETCEAALGRLRAAVVARLVARVPVLDEAALARARPADAAPEAGCAWTEIVVVVDGGPGGAPGERGA